MNDNILLFDGFCNLCNGIVKFTIKRDPKVKFKFAPLQSEIGKELLKKFNLPTKDFETFVFIKNDKCYVKSTAGLEVLRELGGIWKLAYIFIIIPKSFRDLIYNLIAKSRYRIFGKKEYCMIPTPEIENRFLQ